MTWLDRLPAFVAGAGFTLAAAIGLALTRERIQAPPPAASAPAPQIATVGEFVVTCARSCPKAFKVTMQGQGQTLECSCPR